MNQSEKQIPRVALIVPYGELALLPGVINSAAVLADRGYSVDIVAIASDRFGKVPMQHFDGKEVRVHYYYPAGIALLPVAGGYARIGGLARTALRVCASMPYRCLLGIDADGLIAATIVGSRLEVPVVYYSLELELAGGEWRLFINAIRERHSPLLILLRRFIKNRLNIWLKKPWERWAHRRASLTIALDEQRARVLIEDNHHTGANVVIVPTSPLALQRVPDREYLSRKYNLDPKRTLLLQIGGISDVARSLELAGSVSGWPEDWTLILHGFASDEQYLEKLRSLSDGQRLIVSTDMVPYDILDDLVASADLGLAFYRPIDLNYLHMASGKLLHYLKCGLPVVATDFPSLRQILEGNACGLCVSDETEIVAAAQRILRDRERWSANASRCFVEKFEFARRFESVLDHIEKL